MPKIARDYQENVKTIMQSDLTSQKKQRILESIAEQLQVLSDCSQIPDLTNKERAALRDVYAKTRIEIHKLNF
jgi:hypothetical protein